MGWLIGCAAAAALLLPIVLSVHLYLDVGRKKLYFGVYILRALKLFGRVRFARARRRRPAPVPPQGGAAALSGTVCRGQKI